MLQEAEVAKLTALLQKSEMKAKSLELTVEQKAKENEVSGVKMIFLVLSQLFIFQFQELTAICDELIAKVGS